MSSDDSSILGQEQCIIQGEHFFVRARLLLPVPGFDEDFEWGVWVSLSSQSFESITASWDRPGRESDPAYFGWIATELLYPESTLNLKSMVHTQQLGVRPTVELEPTGHPLAIEQQLGITIDRIQQIAELVFH